MRNLLIGAIITFSLYAIGYFFFGEGMEILEYFGEATLVGIITLVCMIAIAFFIGVVYLIGGGAIWLSNWVQDTLNSTYYHDW